MLTYRYYKIIKSYLTLTVHPIILLISNNCSNIRNNFTAKGVLYDMIHYFCITNSL